MSGKQQTDPRRRGLVGLATLVGIGVVALAVGGFLLVYPLRPVGRGEVVEVEISRGISAVEVARTLEQAGVIRSAAAFRRWIRLTRNAHRLKAGWYRFSPNQSGWAILKQLVRGETLRETLVIPEGYTKRDIARAWERAGFGTAQEFLAACDRIAHERGLDVEGYLFPDTYLLERGTRAEQGIQLMLQRFERQWQRLKGPPAGGLSRHEVVILASIVEREARIDEERPLIAGVFYNRLQKGWKLQADPTVAYVLGYPDRPLTLKDLEVDSPYNTYLHPGLPPGPICNPGFASLQAAHTPAKTEMMYFVARGDGTHSFSRTLAEHNRKRREIRLGVQ